MKDGCSGLESIAAYLVPRLNWWRSAKEEKGVS